MKKAVMAGVAVVALLSASQAMAANGNLNASATAAAGITITENTPLNFGLFDAVGNYAPGALCDMDFAAVVTCPSGPTFLGGSSVGALGITGTPNAAVDITIGIDISSPGGELRFDAPLCDDGTTQASCNPNSGYSSVLDGSGSLNLQVTGSLRWDLAPIAPGTYTMVLPVTVDY